MSAPKTNSSTATNHYETLGLKQNCTDRQVRDAFIKLSKTHHPDVNPTDPTQNDKFLKIHEAYQVLSRSASRTAYDSELIYQRNLRQRQYEDGLRVETNAPGYKRWRDESIWSMRDKTREDFNENKPYYGIKGVKRVSNNWIAGGVVMFMLLGTLVHYTLIRHSAVFTVNQLDVKDERITPELYTVRKTARSNGNDHQIALLSEKFGLENGNDGK